MMKCLETGKHPFIKIITKHYTKDNTDKVVRWCPECGSIVVDEESDNRLVKAGGFKKLTPSTLCKKYLNGDIIEAVKTIDDVAKECNLPVNCIYTISQFSEMYNDGLFLPCDGLAYLHDGIKRTNESFFDCKVSDLKNYKYVCCYGK